VTGADSITLVVRLSTAPADARRGIVRLHPEVLDALDLQQWDAVRLTGSRVTAALAAAADETSPPGTARLDDVTLSNSGLTDGASVVVQPTTVSPARRVLLAGSRLATSSLTDAALRHALFGKVLTTGDAVSLLPQDLAPPPGADTSAARTALAGAIGLTWTNELLSVAATEPAGAVTVGPATVLGWQSGQPVRTDDGRAIRPPSPPNAVRAAVPAPPVASEPPADAIPLPPEQLVGNAAAARKLIEWLDLTFRRPELLERLGGRPRLGVLIIGPSGVGKATLTRSAAAAVDASCIELAAPSTSALEPAAAAERVRDAINAARSEATAGRPAVLLITDVEALVPAESPPPLATVALDELRGAMDTRGVALVATTSAPEAVHPRLREPDLIDRELSLPLPDAMTRAELLRLLLRDIPLAGDVDLRAVAERAPGFVAADLVALRREAAVRAALRRGEPTAEPGAGLDGDPRIAQADLLDAVATIRPISMSSAQHLQTGGLTLDAVGDMAKAKQALTEAVLWPLKYPDSFARLGVDAPRGVLIYGPPGGGKTFLVRALAGTGALNVFSVKGAELLDKYVGESERAVRELFRRAADAAPALVFLDEVDALAPRRGQSADSGVADRVVAALLTELDGVEPLRDVVVLGATNRPELIDPALLRPGRLERLIYVPPPDAEARAAILRATARNTPLAPDVDLDALAAGLDGYSAADCAALLREAALSAIRESLEATVVTAAHLEAARRVVGPSLDPAQLIALEAYAASR
jgi:transitional endoplasmic reticulum ATPase